MDEKQKEIVDKIVKGLIDGEENPFARAYAFDWGASNWIMHSALAKAFRVVNGLEKQDAKENDL